MHKIFLSIHNDDGDFEFDLGIEVEVPYIPRIGDVYWTSLEEQNLIVKEIKKLGIEYRFKRINLDDEEDKDFPVIVSEVIYDSDKKRINVHLGNGS